MSPDDDGAAILVVDDEPFVLRSLELILKHAGYSCIACKSGSEAIAVLGSDQGLSAAVVDLSLPDIGGEEVLAAAREHRPELPLVAMSGFGRRLENGRKKLPATSFLAKPFEPNELLAVVERALAGEKAAGRS